MIKKYPKPILCHEHDEASLYKEGLYFRLILNEEEQKIIGDSVELNFTGETNSNKLKELLLLKKIKAFYKIQSDQDSKMCPFELGESISHRLNKDVLCRIDKIKVTLHLIAEEDVILKDNEELIDETSGIEFYFKKGDLLAISNTEIMNYQLSGNPFINISCADKQEDEGIAISSLDKQVIQIMVGPSLNDAYHHIKNKKDIADILNSFLAFNAILYSIEKAVFDESKSYVEKDWFKILEQAYDSPKYDSLKDFIDSMSEEFDIDIVYKEVQKLLNNSLENKIRIVARRTR